MLCNILIWLGSALGGFTQAVTGFGGAIILMLFLPLFLDMKLSTALAGLICVPMVIRMAWHYRKHAKYKVAIIPVISYFIVNYLCLSYLADINMDGLKAAYGVFLILLAVYFTFIADNLKIPANPITGIICGALAGVTGALFGVGGPMFVLYFLAATNSKEDYLGTANTAFALNETYSAIVRTYKGFIPASQLPVVLVAFAFVLAGNYFGVKVVDNMNPKLMKKLIYLVLAISGVSTFVRAMGWI